MHKGEKKMAVVTYKVSLDATGKVASLDPSPDSVVFVKGDFLVFSPVDPGTTILVQLTGGPAVICAVNATGEKVKLNNPAVDAGGNVLISFKGAGGQSGPGSNFPP
jgi:hypothetical protein